MKGARIIALGALMLTGPGCAVVVDDGRVSFVDEDTQLLCEAAGSVILAAQSVPTASHIPCVDAMPSGWRLERTRYRSDAVTVAFESGRAPIDDLTLEFSAECEPAADPVVAESQPLSIPPGAVVTSETIPGGGPVPAIRLVIANEGSCADFLIDLDADEPIGGDDFPTWQWIPRADIERWIADATDERLQLDP